MVRIAICDDERALRKSLRGTLEFEISFHGIAYELEEFDSGESFLVDAGKTHFDILFLDIEMQGLTGMETAQKLRENNQQAVIIFVTAFPDYVFQGYEVQALNYILKPYESGKIVEVLHHALREIDAMEEDFFLLEQKAGTTKLPCEKILYFQSEGRQITAVSAQRADQFYDKLDEIARELPLYFERIHNRYLVNMNHVTAFHTAFLFCGEEKLPVSRSYQKSVAISFAKKLLR